MSDQRTMEEAISEFVEDLEEEQKSNKLIESRQKEKLVENDEENPEEDKYKNYENFVTKDDDFEEITESKEVSGDIEKLKEFIVKIINSVSNSEVSDIKYDRENNKIDIYGKDLGIAIGKNGKNMEAIEYIVNLVARRKNIFDKSVAIDIKDYKRKKYDIIKNIAIKMAKKAVKEGRKIVLKPMPSYERKIVHDALSESKEVKTKSKNKEPYRRIIIYPNKET
ncbi:MAG: R3H domain-containing nucleic acid-binding protein [Actinomycetota bacterium]